MGKTMDEALHDLTADPESARLGARLADLAQTAGLGPDAPARMFFSFLHGAAGSLVEYLHRGRIETGVYCVEARWSVAIVGKGRCVRVTRHGPGGLHVAFGTGWPLTHAVCAVRSVAIPAPGDLPAYNALLARLTDAAHRFLAFGELPTAGWA